MPQRSGKASTKKAAAKPKKEASPQEAPTETSTETTAETAAGTPTVRQQLVKKAPPSRRGRGSTQLDWNAHLAPLVNEPNEWYEVAVYNSASAASANASKLRKGDVEVPHGAGYWEFTTRKNEEDGTSAIYARYIPDEE